jgi:hypothetical protein
MTMAAITAAEQKPARAADLTIRAQINALFNEIEICPSMTVAAPFRVTTRFVTAAENRPARAHRASDG